MEEFDQQLTPANIEHFSDYRVKHYLCFVRLEITEFLLQNVDKHRFWGKRHV